MKKISMETILGVLLFAGLGLLFTRGIQKTAGEAVTKEKQAAVTATVVIDAGQASTSLLQRRCKLGYARAARIMDEMEEKGIIGPYEGAKPRAVLISRQQWLEMQMNQPDE